MSVDSDFRSNCPISCALDLVGDKWSLLILRDMLFFNKQTFKELSSSPEGIASNILCIQLCLPNSYWTRQLKPIHYIA